VRSLSEIRRRMEEWENTLNSIEDRSSIEYAIALNCATVLRNIVTGFDKTDDDIKRRIASLEDYRDSCQRTLEARVREIRERMERGESGLTLPVREKHAVMVPERMIETLKWALGEEKKKKKR